MLMSRSSSRFSRRVSRLTAVGAGLAIVAVAASAAPVTTVSSNFTGFSAGNINGQGGWSKTNNAYHGEVVNLGGTNPVLQVSNRQTSDSFGDWIFGPRPGGTAMSDTNPTNSQPQFFAGESSTGAAYNRFIGSFDFRSVATDNTDLGARITMSPDNGQGGRQGFVALANTASGVSVSTFAVNASGGFVAQPTLATVAFGSWNTLRYEIDFYDGAFNDVANIFLNNSLVATINSWERFYTAFQSVEHPNGVPVQTWLFRAGAGGNVAGTSLPNALGFYIDNVSVQLDNRATVPTPATSLLAGLALVAMLATRRRVKRA
jgi:hypothetical protein